MIIETEETEDDEYSSDDDEEVISRFCTFCGLEFPLNKIFANK